MSKPKQELSSQEAKEKIKAGEELSDFKIDRLSLTKVSIDSPIHIVDCEIGTLDLNHATVLENVTIRRCKIKMLVVSEARFEKKFDFKKSSVGRGRLQRTYFGGPSFFSEAVLAFCSFHKSTFVGPSDFSRCNFLGDATFTDVTFQDNVKFVHSLFKESGVFANAVFQEKADFKHITCRKDMDFSHSSFQGDLLLMNSVVELSLSLLKSNMSGKTDFSSISVGRTLNLLGVTVGENQGFRFINANANPIVFQRDVVEGHVWPEQGGDYLGASREYGFLRTAFEYINRFEDEDWAYYQFKRNERRGRPLSMNPVHLIQRAGNFLFLDIGCGYGTKPFRTLGVIATLVLFFAMCYFMGGMPAPAENLYGLSSPGLNKFMHSLYTSLLAFSGSLADVKLTGFLRILSMLEYMLGVLFMGLFVVAFSRKVIR